MTDDLGTALGELKPLFQELDKLHSRAVQLHAPQVDALVRAGSRDIQRIEHTLDSLLSFCGDAHALALSKRLCRHYWTIDPTATAFYIDSDREMWDSEAPQDEPAGPPSKPPRA